MDSSNKFLTFLISDLNIQRCINGKNKWMSENVKVLSEKINIKTINVKVQSVAIYQVPRDIKKYIWFGKWYNLLYFNFFNKFL